MPVRGDCKSASGTYRNVHEKNVMERITRIDGFFSRCEDPQESCCSNMPIRRNVQHHAAMLAMHGIGFMQEEAAILAGEADF